MTKHILNISPVSLLIVAVFTISISSCKSRKNLAQVTAPVEETEQQVEEEIAEVIEEAPAVEERIPEKIISKEQKLNGYFNAVSSASSVSSANASIEEALTMFSNSDAPVLIVIYNDGASPDYDEPTTIAKYLDYLKDTKSKPAQVEEVVYNTNGQIKELVLKK